MKKQTLLHNKTTRRMTAVMLSAALVTTLFTEFGESFLKDAQAADNAAVTLHNPVYDSGVQEAAPGTQDVAGKLHNPRYNTADDTAEWDCVWFGNYWQSDTNGDGEADKNDTKEPIKWRVLSVDGDDVFLLADKNLDAKPYNTEYEDVTWETCTLRSWLNGYGSADNVCGTDYTGDNFMDAAFSASEQAAIQTTNVLNEDNPDYDTEGGNDTADKIYLLSIAEASNTAYGFNSEFEKASHTRDSLDTAYVVEPWMTSANTADEADYWWLRSPGDYSGSAASVNALGCGDVDGEDVGSGSISSGLLAVRPALHLTLSSSTPLSYAGTVKDSEKATWDCIYFGNYWQSDTNGDGVADKNDKKEPVKWRVLSVDGDDVFLLADKNLDTKCYNAEDEDVTWETCTLRSWLNGYGSADNACGEDYTVDNFIDNAFSAAEQSAIKKTNVMNGDFLRYDEYIEGGNDTADKIYLLSSKEVLSTDYGFYSAFRKNSDTRIALNTMYVREQGVVEGDYNRGYGWWWLRSPGNSNTTAANIYSYGYGNINRAVRDESNAVRPVLHLTLSSSTPLSYAGTICSDGTEKDADGNTPTPTPIPTAKPTAAPGNTSKPTAKPGADATTRPISPTKSPAGNGTATTPKPGQVVRDAASKAFYQIESTGTVDASVTYLRPEGKAKKAKVPAVIYHAGKKYKVTAIAAKAFAGNKKLKNVVIGKNVKIVHENAFKNCKGLRKITVESKVLTKVGKNALKGTNKKLTVKAPKKKKAKYKKLFKKKGNKKVKVV